MNCTAPTSNPSRLAHPRPRASTSPSSLPGQRTSLGRQLVRRRLQSRVCRVTRGDAVLFGAVTVLLSLVLVSCGGREEVSDEMVDATPPAAPAGKPVDPA